MYQRRAARFVMGDFQRTSSVSSMISSLNWTTLETHIKILRLVLFYKILNNHVDILLPDYIMNSVRHYLQLEVTSTHSKKNYKSTGVYGETIFRIQSLRYI